jgi:hypothetical protein
MKIKKVIISNFRAFKHAEFELDDFNCIIGKNDTGKSTLLAALEWFFNTNKKLDSDDYAIASICPNDCPYDSIISVEVHFVGEDIPLGEKSTDKFIFNHDFKRNDCVCIKKKYMYHPNSLEQQIGYSIKQFPFKQIGKILSDCSVEELVNYYTKIKELDDDANELLSELKSQKENRPKRRGVGQLIHDEETKKTENKLKKNLCEKLYKLYSEKNEQIINDQWLDFDDEEDRLPLDWFYSYMFHIYTSQTPISVYLNSIFTPYNTRKLYDSIKEVKAHTAGKITEILKTNYDIGQIAFEEQERVNIFTEDSLVFKHDTSSINIPLKNRGEGIQLAIKNAVIKLLIEIYEKKQSAIFAFEEPETHLHPSAQLEMYKTIKALSKNPNHQVIITTHSPYIVKELANDNINPIVVTQEKGSNESKLEVLSKRVLPYVSMNEINYIAFDEPSIEYHIELYGYMQNKLNKNVSEVDSWLKGKGVDGSHVWYDTRTFSMEQRTLPYCVRNNIDHPLVDGDGEKHVAYTNNNQYDDREVIKESIEIMRNTIVNNPNDFA